MTAPAPLAPAPAVVAPPPVALDAAVSVVSAAVVEPKVQAATASAAITAGMIVPVVLWLLGAYVFGGTVPPQLADALTMLLTAGLTFAAGYRARHVDRAA
jgi:hypothetical protein